VNRRAVASIAVIFALIVLGGQMVGRHLRPITLGEVSADTRSTLPAGAAVTSGPTMSSAPAVRSEPILASAAAAEPSRAVREALTQSIQVEGVADIDPHKAFGSKSAPIVMEIFSDYQCPSCRALYENTNRQLMEDYVTTGKVYLIHRDFPLPMHAYSRVAARYARGAAELGKVEPAEKALFDNQEKWEQSGDVDGTLAAVLSSADMNKVRGLVKGGTLEPLIDKDYQMGQGYHVNSTPTSVFHYKGQTYPYSGVMGWDILKQFLDQLLSQK
jgi:protein-disulfide isomerase